MNASRWVTVSVDLGRVRSNLQQIRGQVGVEVWAVVKADAYGLGAGTVAEATADLVDGWCVFSLEEAVEARLWERTAKGAIALGPPARVGCEDYREHRVRPAVSTVEQAEALQAAGPVLCVDTGMQRFACAPKDVAAVVRAGQCVEAFTHAVTVEQAKRLQDVCGHRGMKLHAAGSALLHHAAARLDAVRPGMAMYRGAVCVATRLVEVRQSHGPVGYGQFNARRHGLILCGYSNGLRKGPCFVNGCKHKILEVGMQSAYVEIDAPNRVGDEVVLLGQGLAETELAVAWRTTPYEVLLALTGSGQRQYA
jgi:alanine racemase